MKKTISLLLCLSFCLALTGGALAAESGITAWEPILRGVEFTDTYYVLPTFVLHVNIPISAYEFRGSYYGSGTLDLEIAYHQGDGNWQIAEESRYRISFEPVMSDVIFRATFNEYASWSKLDGPVYKFSVFKVRLTYGYIDAEGNAQSVSSAWSEAELATTEDLMGVRNVSAYENASDWAEPELDWAAEYSMIPGMVKDKMNQAITREEFAVVAMRLYYSTGNRPKAAPEDTFSDCKNPEVLRAYALGIVQGMGGGKFAPNELITREQMATMIWRTLLLMKPEYKDYSGTASFTDSGQISSWAVEAVMNMAGLEYISGMGSGRFAPLEGATCEQSVLLAFRIFRDYRRI